MVEMLGFDVRLGPNDCVNDAEGGVPKSHLCRFGDGQDVSWESTHKSSVTWRISH